MKSGIFRFITTAVTILMLFLISCGPKSVPVPTTPAPTPGAPAPVAPVTTPVPVTPVPATDQANMINVTLKKLDGTTMKKAVEKPQYGGTLNILRAMSNFGAGQLGVVDSHFLFVNTLLSGDWARGTAGTGEISWQLYEYMSMDHFMPSLAESWEMPDDETIIYHLRKGVRWALDQREASKLVGGRELTADDVVWNLKFHFFSKPATREKLTLGKAVESADVRALDKYTVQVKAPKKDLFFFVGYMSDTLGIVPPEIVEKYGKTAEWDKLVSTGAFMIKDHVLGSVTTFVKNPNYWEADPVLGKDYRLPYLDTIKYFDIADKSTQIASFRTGKLDGTLNLTVEEWKDLSKSYPNLKTKILEFGTSGTRIAMQMNDPKAPWQDIRVRRALMLAINHKEIVDTYFDGAADIEAYPMTGAPEIYALGWKIPLKEMPREVQELYEYHPDKAKQLLAEAGYPNGFKTEFMVSSNSPEFQDLGAMLKAYWAKIGVDLLLDVKESGTFSGITNEAKQCCMTHAGTWGTTTMYNKFAPPPNNFNQGNVDDPRINELRAQMFDVLWNVEKRTPIMRELYKHTMSQVWFLPLPSKWSYKVYQPWVKNYDAENSVGYWGQSWRFVWIDRDLKKKLGY